MIVVKKKSLKIRELKNLVIDLIGDLDILSPGDVRGKGILGSITDVEAKYYLIQLLKQTEPILDSYNAVKDELVRSYLPENETKITSDHPQWDEFIQKLSSLLGIEVTVSIPTIPIEKFSGVSGEGTFIHFYNHIIGDKSWGTSSQLTELQKKMKGAITTQPESTKQTKEVKPTKGSQESIIPIGLDGKK